jgi:hypothetical protein
MEFPLINYWAVIVAAGSTFALGSLWYSPLMFEKPWMKELGFTKEGMKNTNMLKIYGIALILMFIIAFNLAAFI